MHVIFVVAFPHTVIGKNLDRSVRYIFVSVCFFSCETMSGVARPPCVVLSFETHPKSVGVCSR